MSPDAIPITNDNVNLNPQTTFDGPNLTFDFPSLRIGVAEYAEGPTGCTMFCFPEPFETAIDIRGGGSGTIGDCERNHAICFAGGSLYGLEAAMGATAEIWAQHQYRIDLDTNIFIWVSGAIIYDFLERDNRIYPDLALGRAAVSAARTGVFPLGRRGAGRSATVGKWWYGHESSGQGGAFLQNGSTKIAVFTVVNAFGAIMNRTGEAVRGHLDHETGKRHAVRDFYQNFSAKSGADSSAGNTTLTLVLTNQKLNRIELQQLARQVHSSMARAIEPFHTIGDGDVLYAVTTDEIDNPDLNYWALCTLASEVAWDAVLSCYSDDSSS